MLIPRIVISVVLLLTIGPARAQLPAGIDSSGLYFQTPAGGLLQATRLTTAIDVDVTGIIARVTVRQRFRNSSSDWIEGVYVFPLPDDSAVDRLTMQIGDRRIEGEIAEREQARKTYERAREAGQQASLVEQERPNLFTTSVANIAPGQEIVIEIGYLQTAHYDDGVFSLGVPLTLTPRFNPASVGDAARVTPPFVADATAVPGGTGTTNDATIRVRLDPGLPLEMLSSPSHVSYSHTDGRFYSLTTADATVPMDRDFVLNWRYVAGQTVQATAFTETVGNQNFALLMFVPPTSVDLSLTTPREMIYVIDTSGSMGGASLEQARSTLSDALDRLRAADRFNVIEFNSTARALFPEPMSFTAQAIARAHRFVRGLDAHGGTNIAAALSTAVGQPQARGYLRQIVFITDGSVGNETELFGLIRDGLGAARLFTIGIGTAPNMHFMRKAAQFGRGSYVQIARPEDVAPAMNRLFTKLEHVALTDIDVRWPAGAEVYPKRIPDLYQGEPVVIAARLDRPLARTLTIEATGQAGLYPWSGRIAITPGQADGVATLWARRKIEYLLDLDPANRNSVATRTAVLAIALEHRILSPYTSLVAVDKTPEITRNALLRREQVANLLPAGTDYPVRTGLLARTATDAGWYRLIGAVLAALALALSLIWRLYLRPAR